LAEGNVYSKDLLKKGKNQIIKSKTKSESMIILTKKDKKE